MMWRVPETTCRHVRITAASPDPQFRLSSGLLRQLENNVAPGSLSIKENADHFQMGYAEIELFAHGENVALGKPVQSENMLFSEHRDLSALTDGHNLYGRILPIRAWIHQLARRHELETERPLIEAEINRRYTRQKTNLSRMYWLSGALAVGIAIALIVARLLHLHQLKLIKKRMAADLHDELGANLHAIGLFGDLAKLEVANEKDAERWRALNQYLDEVRALSETTSAATRHRSHMLDADAYREDLVLEMKRIAERFMADLRHESSFAENESFDHLKPRKRMDLILFYTECLANIIQHSNATHVSTTLRVEGNRLSLIVEDNGAGVAGKIPPSLKRRAHLMRGKLRVETASPSGARVTLNLRVRAKKMP